MKNRVWILFGLLVLSCLFYFNHKVHQESLVQQERIERAIIQLNNTSERQMSRLIRQIQQPQQLGHRTYEYLVETYSDTNITNIQQHLTQRGREGWRLIQTRMVFISDISDDTGAEVWYVR